MKFIELNNQLRNQIGHLYNIKGDDAFLVQKAISNFKSFIITDFEEFDYVKFDAEKMKSEQVYEQIVTMPLGNEKRLIVLVSPNQDIVKFLNSYNFEDCASVVVCVNAIGLNGEVVDCSQLDKKDVVKYVLNKLSKEGMSIEEKALDYLLDATASDMTKLNNELSKVTAYCVDEKIITLDVVLNLVSSSDDYAVYMLTNAIDNKNIIEYTKILNQMKKSQSSSEIFAYLGKYFKRMQYVALNREDTEIAKILNLKPYAHQIAKQNVSKNGVKYYINLYQKYVELDFKIKSGKISATNALHELLF